MWGIGRGSKGYTVYVCAYVCVCVHVCVHVCVYVCVYVCICVHGGFHHKGTRGRTEGWGVWGEQGVY